MFRNPALKSIVGSLIDNYRRNAGWLQAKMREMDDAILRLTKERDAAINALLALGIPETARQELLEQVSPEDLFRLREETGKSELERFIEKWATGKE